MSNRRWNAMMLVFVLLVGACQQNAMDSSSTETEPLHELDQELKPSPPGERHAEDEPMTITLPPEALETQIFSTVPVERRQLVERIHATATIKPNEYKLTHVSPRIEGKAIEVFAELGDDVEPGQILASLDSIELGYKKSAFRQARAHLLVTKANYEREKRLFEQRISSEKDYLGAKGAYLQSLATYQAAYEALELVGLSPQEIQQIVARKKDHRPLSIFPLKAPRAGTIIARHLTPGELITPKDKPFTIADLTTVWILLDIYEKDVARIRTGAKVRMTVDAYPDETFHGTVVYLGNILNPDTRTVEARVEIPNPDRRLRPGMFARAAVETSALSEQETLVVPRDAVQDIEQRSVVFVEKQAGTYELRPVTLGRQEDDHVEILAGVQEGERVVTQGSFYLKSIVLGEQLGGHAH
ncbi:MAG: efflux RND transporter periplasmic adaptor subunit [Nitrospirae bacterium]|nr:MAG: efflux RND transporter periplasmic adaptor subunit [Nitrospirota bacterium]